MTTPPSFPTLPGQGWSVHKRPTFSTRVASHVSGREVRAPLYYQGLYEFELTIDGLDSNGTFTGLTANSLQTLMGFYVGLQGQYGTFLYTDPTDHQATAQAARNTTTGTYVGDGTTSVFTLGRAIGGTWEPISWANSPLTNVYLNGVNQASGWTLTQPNTLTFTTAPGSGVTVTVTFTYAFNCRFLDDQEDFENFMNGLWRVQTLKFRMVKP
jgi:uncharacterized protein (TIGR02217 family)